MSKNVQYTNVQGIYRALALRFKSKKQNNVFEQALQLDKKIAFATARKIPVECTHLVISQNLLPFLYESGVLGGRTFDVLMTRLPFEKLHERLDAAFSTHQGSATLRDFRASEKLVTLENKALTLARNIITPHSEIKEFCLWAKHQGIADINDAMKLAYKVNLAADEENEIAGEGYFQVKELLGLGQQGVAEEGLDADQKRVGQLGPTSKVKNNNIGKLVGANENFIGMAPQAVAEGQEDLDRILTIMNHRR
jgi:hypothetical protein